MKKSKRNIHRRKRHIAISNKNWHVLSKGEIEVSHREKTLNLKGRLIKPANYVDYNKYIPRECRQY